jgi:FkbM family methyltransferase
MPESALVHLARSAIRRVPAVRAVVRSRGVQQVVRTVRGARSVHETTRFGALQLGRPRVAAYRLRESGLVVFLRHRTRDIDILHEIFGGTPGRQGYEVPARAAGLLDEADRPRVMDVGANVGLFSAYVLSRWPDARILAFEPDPANAALLRRTIGANRLGDRWRVEQAAVSTRDGHVSFAAGLFADSHIADGDRGHPTVTVPTRDIFGEDHAVDLLKIDIEGGEWPILLDGRLATLGARVLVMEWHRRGTAAADPQRAATERLRAAGYWIVDRSPRAGEEADQGVLWAIRDGHVAP